MLRFDERRVYTNEIRRRNEASVRSYRSIPPPSQSFHESSFVEGDRMDIVTRNDRSINRVDRSPTIDLDNKILWKACAFWRRLETIRLSWSSGHLGWFRATLNPIAISPDAGGNGGIPLSSSPPLVHASGPLHPRHGHSPWWWPYHYTTFDRRPFLYPVCILVFAYLVCQCCIDRLEGGEGYDDSLSSNSIGTGKTTTRAGGWLEVGRILCV